LFPVRYRNKQNQRKEQKRDSNFCVENYETKHVIADKKLKISLKFSDPFTISLTIPGIEKAKKYKNAKTIFFFFVFLTKNTPTMHPWPMTVARIRVADPDPNWIRIQSGQWIRIRIQEGKNYPKK
jgi:hypothetical protein